MGDITRFQSRNRYDVTYVFEDGSKIRWMSRKDRSLTWIEMVRKLRDIADVIEKNGLEAEAE